MGTGEGTAPVERLGMEQTTPWLQWQCAFCVDDQVYHGTVRNLCLDDATMIMEAVAVGGIGGMEEGEAGRVGADNEESVR